MAMALYERKGPKKAQTQPIQTVHKLVDQLIEVAQKYGDQPPVVMVMQNGDYRRYVITKVEICGAADHTLLLAVPE